jgi:predicted DNA-binding ribbon-helix-helix protein
MSKKKRGRPPANGPTPRRSIRVPEREWERWQDIARRRGVTVTEWLMELARKELAKPIITD